MPEKKPGAFGQSSVFGSLQKAVKQTVKRLGVKNQKNVQQLPSPTWIGAFRFFYQLDLSGPGPFAAFELRPPFSGASDPGHLAALPAATPRSFELWREGNRVRAVVCGTSDHVLAPYKLAYPGLRFSPIKEIEPSWVASISDENPPVVFDVELVHSLPFGAYSVSPRFADELVSSLPEEAWIQIIYERWDWSAYAERTAHAIETFFEYLRQGEETFVLGKGFKTIPFPPELTGSPLAQLGPLLTKEFIERAHSVSPVIAHVRGVVRCDDASLASLDSALTSMINITTDIPVVIDETDSRALEWFRQRVIPHPTRFLEILSAQTFGRHGVAPWGSGREFIPVLCMSPKELVPLIALPSSETLRDLFAPSKGEKALVLGDEI